MADQKKNFDHRLRLISDEPSGLSPESRAKCNELKRWHERDPIFKPAKVFTGRGASVRCVVLDVNAKGARVALDGNFDLPDVVVLRFDQTKASYSARVVWRDRNEYGLSYRMMSWQRAPSKSEPL